LAEFIFINWIWFFGGLFVLIFILNSVRVIGPTEIGLVRKHMGFGKLKDSPVAFKGEAGYQAKILMPGIRFVFWPIFSVRKFPWVQVPAGKIGIVFSQIGDPLPIGNKSAIYKKEFGLFSDVNAFVKNGGQKGLQRTVLPPGTNLPIHPVAFVVAVGTRQIFGLPQSRDFQQQLYSLVDTSFDQVVIKPNGTTDVIGIVTTHEGPPSENGAMASRIGGFTDLEEEENRQKGSGECGKEDNRLIELILASKNDLHNSYQDFQAFLDNGGKIGLQHDPLPYGTYSLNPFLVSVEIVDMLVVAQGEVAVIKSYIGLPTEDTSGTDFKFGTLVIPGHRGIWREPLRTGKYAINPRIYGHEKVPTYILNLSWADQASKAHDLDSALSPINARSTEGFEFKIDLQVQIHVPDIMASKVISSVGTMTNLVMEVLHPAVGNYFRDKIQGLPAVTFIQQRMVVQKEAHDHIVDHLKIYDVEVKGVYIQDVVLPEAMTTVLKDREIANQQKATFKMQKDAEDQRIQMENSKGLANQQADLVKSEIGVQIAKNQSEQKKAMADGESTYISKVGEAKSVEVRAVGMAKAEAYAKQAEVLGQHGTAMVNIFTSLAENQIPIVPKIQGGSGNSSMEAAILGYLAPKLDEMKDEIQKTPKISKEPGENK